MKKIFKYFVFTLLFGFFAFLFAGVNYVMPHYSATTIKGIEVKRVDKDGPISKANPADGPTQDMYYIYTQKPDNDEKVMVYRNEDTRWGFPFYFKFDSANLQAQAQSFSVGNKLVQIKSYGWRITMLNEFPNVISIKHLDNANDVAKPILSYVLYILLACALFFSVQFVRGWFDSKE